jgi:hypothetical protein
MKPTSLMIYGPTGSMMVIEDQFSGVEIADEHVDQIEVVCDLIRHMENVDNEMTTLQFSALRSSIRPHFSSCAEQQDRREQEIALAGGAECSKREPLCSGIPPNAFSGLLRRRAMTRGRAYEISKVARTRKLEGGACADESRRTWRRC